MLKGRPKGGSAEKKKKGQLNKYCMQSRDPAGPFVSCTIRWAGSRADGRGIHTWPCLLGIPMGCGVGRCCTWTYPPRSTRGRDHGVCDQVQESSVTSNLYPPKSCPSAGAAWDSSLQSFFSPCLLHTPVPQPCTGALAEPISSMLPTAGLELTAILPQPPKCRILRPF